jgi:hypothetical protein
VRQWRKELAAGAESRQVFLEQPLVRNGMALCRCSRPARRAWLIKRQSMLLDALPIERRSCQPGTLPHEQQPVCQVLQSPQLHQSGRCNMALQLTMSQAQRVKQGLTSTEILLQHLAPPASIKMLVSAKPRNMCRGAPASCGRQELCFSKTWLWLVAPGLGQ